MEIFLSKFYIFFTLKKTKLDIFVNIFTYNQQQADQTIALQKESLLKELWMPLLM